jgi:adenine/guanine phosphoribosyltransferase-like PRPP-binding protein
MLKSKRTYDMYDIMRSISGLQINLGVAFVRRHKHQLAHFFDDFKKKSAQRIAQPLLSYKLDAGKFDTLGTLWVKESDIDRKSLRLLQTIEDSYMSTSFFLKSGKQIGSRGYVYYVSAARDEDAMRAMLRLVTHASTSAQLLGELYPHNKDRWEVGIYALLDDIRYKLLILDEHFSYTGTEEGALLNEATTMFYDYLQGIMPEQGEVLELVDVLQAFFMEIIKTQTPLDLRAYKEADHPLQNIIFRDTLIERLHTTPVDVLLGIRHGGTELPHLLRKYLPDAGIAKVRVSNYSASTSQSLDFSKIVQPHQSVLVLDDNVLTGRTLQLVVDALRKNGNRAIYFGCVTYSGMKRYPQMIMDGHGVVNPEVLSSSCTVGESPYTQITNSRSYKNKNGVFDKVKGALQRRMDNKRLGYRI